MIETSHQRAQRRWKERHPTHEANYRLKKRYGITLAQKELLLQEQGNKCAICLCNIESTTKCAVDHDHTTKRIRGILCIGCNRSMGRLGDSYEKLERVAMYLASAEMGYRFVGAEGGGNILI